MILILIYLMTEGGADILLPGITSSRSWIFSGLPGGFFWENCLEKLSRTSVISWSKSSQKITLIIRVYIIYVLFWKRCEAFPVSVLPMRILKRERLPRGISVRCS